MGSSIRKQRERKQREQLILDSALHVLIKDGYLTRTSHHVFGMAFLSVRWGVCVGRLDGLGHERRTEVQRSAVRGRFWGCPERFERTPIVVRLGLVHQNDSEGQGAGQQRRRIGRRRTRWS